MSLGVEQGQRKAASHIRGLTHQLQEKDRSAKAGKNGEIKGGRG